MRFEADIISDSFQRTAVGTDISGRMEQLQNVLHI